MIKRHAEDSVAVGQTTMPPQMAFKSKPRGLGALYGSSTSTPKTPGSPSVPELPAAPQKVDIRTEVPTPPKPPKAHGLGVLHGAAASASSSSSASPPKPKKPNDIVEALRLLHANAKAKPLGEQSAAELNEMAAQLGRLQSWALLLAEKREEEELAGAERARAAEHAAAMKEAEFGAAEAHRRHQSIAGDIDTMSAGDLRHLIKRAGLSSDGCLEKSELRDRAREARQVLVDGECGAEGDLHAKGDAGGEHGGRGEDDSYYYAKD